MRFHQLDKKRMVMYDDLLFFFYIRIKGDKRVIERGSFSDEDILIFLSQLVASFGVRMDFDARMAKRYFSRGELARVIREIKNFMGLSCSIGVTLVKSGFLAFAQQSPTLTEATKNELRHMPHGRRSVAAIVSYPASLPLYGSPEFSDASFSLLVDAGHFARQSYEVFVYGMAHELSHILLASSRHPLQDLETAVDLSVMVLGFGKFMMIGSIIKERSYGYLTRHQREIAYAEIKRLRKK